MRDYNGQQKQFASSNNIRCSDFRNESTGGSDRGGFDRDGQVALPAWQQGIGLAGGDGLVGTGAAIEQGSADFSRACS